MLGIEFLSLCINSGTIICKPQQALSVRVISLIPAANVLRLLFPYWPHPCNCPSEAACGPCPTTLYYGLDLSLHFTSPGLCALDFAPHTASHPETATPPARRGSNIQWLKKAMPSRCIAGFGSQENWPSRRQAAMPWGMQNCLGAWLQRREDELSPGSTDQLAIPVPARDRQLLCFP